MGITNLLPFVKNACRPGNIRELEGQTVAVDISCFLHKGLFGCVQQTAEGLNTKNYISYVQRRVEALLNLNCHVVLVFDGAPLPAKKGVNDQRRENRMENMRVGTFLLSQGKRDEAVGRLQRAVSLTRDVIEDTLEAFQRMPRVDVIVAPYEADAQLAFLLKNNLADVVITEDSDLIVFGCSKIVFKWEFESESCTIYEKSLLPNCFTGEMNRNFDFIKFRRICILSGCDYLQNGLPGVGLSKSYNFFTKTSQTQLEKILPRIPSYLKMPKLVVTNSFVQDFIKAEQTFLHQIVFDPRQRKQRPLTSYRNETYEGLLFAGSIAEDSDAVRHSLGNIISESAISDKFQLPEVIPSWSVWTNQISNNESEEKPNEEIILGNITEKVEEKSIPCHLSTILAKPNIEEKKEGLFLADKTKEHVNTSCRYFKRRKNTCSNPFKKPKIQLEVDNCVNGDMTIPCDEKIENSLHTNQIQSGFRFSGLRRKSNVP